MTLTAHERLIAEEPGPIPVCLPRVQVPRPFIPHVHGCPECYCLWKCPHTCAVDNDLGTETMKQGSYALCPLCEAAWKCRCPPEPEMPEVPDEQLPLDFNPRVYELEDE